MKKPMWNSEAVKAYETGQGVELVNTPHPHYRPLPKDLNPESLEIVEIDLPPPWAKLIQGVRVEGDFVIVKVKGGNDAARELCGALIEEINK